MIRCSSAGKICTNRPTFDEAAMMVAADKVKAKIGEDYDPLKMEEYAKTKGVMTIAKEVLKHMENHKAVQEDPLPDGAKSYLQERWLELNMEFMDVSMVSGNTATRKGNLVEDDAISMVGTLYNLDITKNEERITKGFLTGECDVIYQTPTHKIIRDNKSPETWKTFRAKTGISPEYYWQLISYCHQYGAKEAYLDYTLMPDPPEVEEERTKYMSDGDIARYYAMQNSIEALPAEKRVKTYHISQEQVNNDLSFFQARLAKAEAYYNTLTYEKCMKIY